LILRPKPKQNSETKADNTSVRRFFAKPFVKRISCFCFFGTKNLFNKLFRAKTRSAVNVPRLGEGPEFKNRQPKPKLNNVPMLMLLLPAKFLQFSLN